MAYYSLMGLQGTEQCLRPGKQIKDRNIIELRYQHRHFGHDTFQCYKCSVHHSLVCTDQIKATISYSACPMLERIKVMILHHNPNPSHKGINQRGRANLSRLRLPALPEEEGGSVPARTRDLRPTQRRRLGKRTGFRG